jgi:bifunctional pyridoxal-dependent enzyme with beta-cystathionase and maltose regulon repressor activities
MLFPIDQRGLLQLNRERFDFNIEFEQLFFSIIPSVVFISTGAWRALSRARKPVVVKAPVFQLIKLVYSHSCLQRETSTVLTELP